MSKTFRAYHGREVALATKHHKEEVLGPPLLQKVGITLVVPEGLDTDLLGTFSGEVERPGVSRDVAVKKACLGMNALGLPLGLASEGSFGPHPQWMFMPVDHELLAFVDADQGITVVEQVLSTETNYSHIRVSAMDHDLMDFLSRAAFPSHGVVVRPDSGWQPGFLFKGITDSKTLGEAVEQCIGVSDNGYVHVETDMRAHMNPSRRAVLRQAAEALGTRLATPCPACGTPGWGVVDVIRGLLCEECGTKTTLVCAEVYGCVRCDYQQESPRGDGILKASPEFCPWCNP